MLHSRVLTSLTPTSRTPNPSGRRNTTAASRAVGWHSRRRCPPRAGHTGDSLTPRGHRTRSEGGRRLASTANCMGTRGRRKDCRSHEIRVQGWKPRESKKAETSRTDSGAVAGGQEDNNLTPGSCPGRRHRSEAKGGSRGWQGQGRPQGPPRP